MKKRHSILFAHPTGSPFARHAACALEEAGLLGEIATTMHFGRANRLRTFVSRVRYRPLQFIEKELSRRSWFDSAEVPQLTGAKVSAWPTRELVRIALSRLGIARKVGVAPQKLTDWSFGALDRSVATKLSRGTSFTAVYCYEDCCLEIFTAAHEIGALCLYDLPILFHRQAEEIYSEEAESFPEFREVLLGSSSQSKCERKEQELTLADHIFVASSVTKRSLTCSGIPEAKISVIPYGVSGETFYSGERPHGRFRVLFVGRIGPRKGFHYLARAWNELNLSGAELRAVGVDEFPEGWLERHAPRVTHVPQLRHSELRREYCGASVLVLPSLVEGFGMVILEAMRCGIPVIATSNTAAADIIEDGIDGFVIPIRDVQAIKEKLLWCASNPDALHAMGCAAEMKAQQYTWKRYREQLAAKVSALIN